MSLLRNLKRYGAEGGTRTPTSYLTRPSNVRVCQFRHFGLIVKRHYITTKLHEPKTQTNTKHYFGLEAGDGLASGLAVGLAAGEASCVGEGEACCVGEGSASVD